MLEYSPLVKLGRQDRCQPQSRVVYSHLAPKPQSPKLRARSARNFGLWGFAFGWVTIGGKPLALKPIVRIAGYKNRVAGWRYEMEWETAVSHSISYRHPATL